MKLPTDVNELRKLVTKATNAVAEIERKERDAENRALIGKCFQFNDGYAGTGKRWWNYAKVIGAKDGDLVLFTFETRPDGQIYITLKLELRRLTEGYLPIPNRTFKAEWRKLQKRLAKLIP